MPREQSATLAFNRGVLSALGLARVDLTRYRMAAALMVNWMGRVLGSMMLRTGWAYLTATLGNQQAKTIPFIFSATDLARIEVTQGALRVLVQDALVTRPAVTAAVTNGSFAANLAGWTNSSEAGAAATWVSAGQVSLVGTSNNNAILDQQIAVNQVGVEHALRIIVTRGPVVFRCGTALGDDSYINQTTLGTGTHSLTVTPTGASFWIRFMNAQVNASLLASCNIEAAGILTLPAPWQTTDLANLRWTQSGDVMYVGCRSRLQQKIERRSLRSWSIVNYEPVTGPFRTLNVTPVTLAPSAIQGDITLTANKPFFKPGHVGALFRLISVGQQVTAALAAADVYTNPIRVNGVGSQRAFAINVSGVFVATVTLQYSVAAPGQWVDVESYTAPTTKNYNDTFDNQVIYYRLGIKPANYTSGTANASLSFSSGSITGIARITAYTDSQHVNAAVLRPFGATTATTNWNEGAWSAFRGYPQTPALMQGRLWWFGISIFASASDDYENFDDTLLGDSAPIIGQLDEGPVDNIYWALALQQLVLGTASAEVSCRSTFLGDPITPTNFNVMASSTQGSANVAALRMDKSGVFVQVSTQRLYALDLDVYSYSYKATELTLLVPDYNNVGIVQLAIQRRPDTRLHCLRADGTVAVMVYDVSENVTCWLELNTRGAVEDISVLPGVGEDQVYYIVRRTVNGATVRFHEKWALESECTGLPIAKHADAHIVYSGPAVTTIGGLGHLEGQTVVCWGWNTVTPFIDGNGNTVGRDLGTYVVTGAQITGVTAPVTNACIGLGYTANWQSMKQAFAAALGTPLNQPKRIDGLGLVLRNTHAQGIRVGRDFAHLDDIPYSDLPRLSSDDGAAPDLDAILNDYDHRASAFNDIWSTDSRVCLQAAAPRPATCLAFTCGMTTNG